MSHRVFVNTKYMFGMVHVNNEHEWIRAEMEALEKVCIDTCGVPCLSIQDTRCFAQRLLELCDQLDADKQPV